MIVNLEPSDTYTVRLWKAYGPQKMVKTGLVGAVMDEIENVYCDDLQAVIKRVYDNAINQHCGGFVRMH
jgi:hypothetical protein